jgi:D-alanyl-D-alanine carboxypeptidase
MKQSPLSRPCRRRPVAAWLLLLLLLLTPACRYEPPATATSTAVAVAAAPPQAMPEQPTATPVAVSPATPTPRPVSPTPLASPTPPASATASAIAATPHSSTAVCGLYLPITSPAVTPPIEYLDRDIPADWQVPDAARPALAYLLAHPGDVGLAAYRVGQEELGVYLNADVPMPLASVVKLVHLAAYAEAVANGRLDPAAWVDVADLERFFLPGSDLRSHLRSIEELDGRGLVRRDPPAVPLEELPWMMIRHSSNAASDYLHLLLGQETIEQTALALGLSSQTAPCPFLGQFLLISNHTRSQDNSQVIGALIDDPLQYGQEVMRFTEAYSQSEGFREAEGRWYQRARRPTWEAQSLFSENLNAQGSARDYAGLMALFGQEGLSTAYASFLARRYLEWPMAVYPVNPELFHMAGYKNGSLPGILTTVYYASPQGQGGLVVVALFYRRLPQATYQEWRRSLAHDELARWLLSDPQAIPALRRFLAEP